MTGSRSHSRREFLEHAAAGVLGAAASSACAPARNGTQTDTPGLDRSHDCNPTPSNALGPYHRAEAPARSALNVNQAEGDRLVISGMVAGLDCPASLGVVQMDVWHCDVRGDYDNDSDAFAFRGRFDTARDGAYSIETLLPGRYQDGGTFRPRHIHFVVTGPGYAPLTTQLFFDDDEFNQVDELFDPELAHPLVDDGEGGWTVTFDIVLETML
jgi:protocatechuate 3,4-dioxygenase beta subunit